MYRGDEVVVVKREGKLDKGTLSKPIIKQDEDTKRVFVKAAEEV
ncbi:MULTISPECIES: hypothetical protein [Myroides]|nr:hypothetical protein [Myroides phaeus]